LRLFSPAQNLSPKKTQKNENESKVRDVYTINGEFGGPPIEVHRGDVLHVTLVNEIPVEYPQVRREERGKRSEKRQRRGKK
jgi:FtsP/CotA-like multicopper oxidase with cupredoxin domain